MDFIKLDNEIRVITDDEKRTDLTDYYNSLKKSEINGKYVYIFDSLINDNEDFRITRHDRFIEVPMHKHTFIEINYVYDGQCQQIIDGKSVLLKKGEICIIDTDIPHAIMETSTKDIIINVLIQKKYFNANFFKNVSRKGILLDFLLNSISYTQKHDQYIIFHSSENKHIPLLFKQLLWETYHPSTGSYQMQESYLNLLFLNLVRIFEYDTNKRVNSANNQYSMMEIMKYIESNYSNSSLSSIAKQFSYTPNYLSSLIKNNFNKNYSEIVLELKLNQAAFLLVNTNITINDIAKQAGFTNLTLFYKKFKQHFQLLPKEYRERNK
ncbi:AraC family transcriptional regulator [Enterococcus sp. DIV0240d]|uniref:AraC family transcriptional regulator n=1 Tax=Enterococcus sp. DIV0240d TaxID=2774717 RepID=UPI003F2890A6